MHNLCFQYYYIDWELGSLTFINRRRPLSCARSSPSLLRLQLVLDPFPCVGSFVVFCRWVLSVSMGGSTPRWYLELLPSQAFLNSPLNALGVDLSKILLTESLCIKITRSLKPWSILFIHFIVIYVVILSPSHLSI